MIAIPALEWLIQELARVDHGAVNLNRLTFCDAGRHD